MCFSFHCFFFLFFLLLPPDQDGRHQFTLQDPQLEAQDQRNKGSACRTLPGALQTHDEGRRHFEVRPLTLWGYKAYMFPGMSHEVFRN